MTTQGRLPVPDHAEPLLDFPTQVAARPRLGRWISAVLVIGAGIAISRSLYNNPAVDHEAIARFMFSRAILEGLWATFVLGSLGMVLAVVVGIIVATCKMSSNPVLKAVGWFYVWAFRGTPLLVQLLILGNFSLFYKTIGVWLPFRDVALAQVDTNVVLTAFTASVLALGLAEGAYMAEIIRSGVISIEPGQLSAARALAMPKMLTYRTVVLPQAMRIITPPTGNQFIGLLKATSLVSVIAGGDLLTQAQNISSSNLKTIELLIVATTWYLVVTSVASAGQLVMERRLARGSRRMGRAVASATELDSAMKEAMP